MHTGSILRPTSPPKKVVGELSIADPKAVAPNLCVHQNHLEVLLEQASWAPSPRASDLGGLGPENLRF